MSLDNHYLGGGNSFLMASRAAAKGSNLQLGILPDSLNIYMKEFTLAGTSLTMTMTRRQKCCGSCQIHFWHRYTFSTVSCIIYIQAVYEYYPKNPKTKAGSRPTTPQYIKTLPVRQTYIFIMQYYEKYVTNPSTIQFSIFDSIFSS